MIRSLLAHADISTTQRYAHLGDDPVKAAVDRTAGSIAAMLEGAGTPVTTIRRARYPDPAQRRGRRKRSLHRMDPV